MQTNCTGVQRHYLRKRKVDDKERGEEKRDDSNARGIANTYSHVHMCAYTHKVVLQHEGRIEGGDGIRTSARW